MTQQTRSPEEVLRQEGILLRPNAGASMRPLIREGRDILVIRPLDGPVRPMDVVLFTGRRNGEKVYLLHRVLYAEADGSVITAGDNCVTTEHVRPEELLGRLTELRRGEKTVRPDSLLCRLYVRLWCRPWRLRRGLLRLRNAVRGSISRGLRALRGIAS